MKVDVAWMVSIFIRGSSEERTVGFECRILITGIRHMNPGREVSRKALRQMAEWGLRLGLEDPRYENPLFGLYALLRTTAGIPLTVLAHVKQGGFKGFITGWTRVRNKWLYRFYLWIYSLRIKPPKNRYEMLKEYSRIAKLRAERSLN